MTPSRSLNVAILAMGGEGGGVLTDWLVHIGEKRGYHVQTTSVPGVAQRTGATLYYVELFPMNDGSAPSPVLGLVPMPGDVDLVVASELMEAGRAIQRGLVTPDRTCLVASTHRVFSMLERTALADGRVDSNAILVACEKASLKFVGFDMQRIADAHSSVISAALLGAVAGSGALPFERQDYEDAIQFSGKAATANLSAFAAAYDDTVGRAAPASSPSEQELGASSPHSELSSVIGGEAREIIATGLSRTADYQDARYAREYQDRLMRFISLAERTGREGQALLCEVARQLALGMTYEDTIRVAELKVRRSRFDRVRTEVNASPGQIIEIVEFMHPRAQEIADTLPAPLGRWLLRSRPMAAFLKKVTSRGRMVKTTSLSGFLLLYGLASFKRIRRSTLRYERECRLITEWLATVELTAEKDISRAIGFAELRSLIKGYGETYERGVSKYSTIRSFLLSEAGEGFGGVAIASLITAANRDENGNALAAEIEKLKTAERIG